jgi:hypothetical protein
MGEPVFSTSRQEWRAPDYQKSGAVIGLRGGNMLKRITATVLVALALALGAATTAAAAVAGDPGMTHDMTYD